MWFLSMRYIIQLMDHVAIITQLMSHSEKGAHEEITKNVLNSIYFYEKFDFLYKHFILL